MTETCVHKDGGHTAAQKGSENVMSAPSWRAEADTADVNTAETVYVRLKIVVKTRFDHMKKL